MSYPAATLLEAQRLHRAGWNPYQIRERMIVDALVDKVPTVPTLRRWVDAGYEARQRESSRAAKLRRRDVAAQEAHDFRLRHHSDATVAAYARTLRENGASLSAVGVVLRVTTGVEHSRREVSRIVTLGTHSPWTL